MSQVVFELNEGVSSLFYFSPFTTEKTALSRIELSAMP